MLTLFAAVVVAIAFVYSWRAGKSGLTKSLAIMSVAWIGLYMVLLMGVSLSSSGKVLALDQQKHFCGFYLDCHLGVSVADVTTSKTLGNPPDQKTAQGTYYIVNLRVLNEARRATLAPYDLDVRIVSDEQVIQRSQDAEAALETAGGKAIDLNQRVAPGTAYTKQVVFDVPSNVTQPKLLVTEGLWIDHLLEFFLIGDEDSFLHNHTYL